MSWITVGAGVGLVLGSPVGAALGAWIGAVVDDNEKRKDHIIHSCPHCGSENGFGV